MVQAVIADMSNIDIQVGKCKQGRKSLQSILRIDNGTSCYWHTDLKKIRHSFQSASRQLGIDQMLELVF